MNYGRLFSRSLHLVWQHKILWFFGLLMGLGSYVTDFVSGRILEQLPNRFWEIQEWSNTLPNLTMNQFSGITTGSFVAIFLAVIAFWLITTLGEGALIGCVQRLEQGERISAKQGLVTSYGLLGRFVAIDTIVFFPWFLVALAAMSLVLALLGSVGFLAYQRAELESVMGVVGIGVACLLPLLCLLLPIGYLTVIFRTLAFRDSAVRQTGVRESIRHTWQTIRQHWGPVLMITVLVWGLNIAFGLLLSLISVPLTAVSPLFLPSSLLSLLLSLFDLLLIIPQAILQTFNATLWTLAYLEIMNYEL